jgi:hypothetical protein
VFFYLWAIASVSAGLIGSDCSSCPHILADLALFSCLSTLLSLYQMWMPLPLDGRVQEVFLVAGPVSDAHAGGGSLCGAASGGGDSGL